MVLNGRLVPWSREESQTLCTCGHSKLLHVHFNSVNHKGETVPTYCGFPTESGECECEKFLSRDEVCDYCERLFDKPSIGNDCEAKHRQPDYAQKIAHAIEKDISDRRGLKSEWNQIDDDIQEEIRDGWAAIVREGIRSA